MRAHEFITEDQKRRPEISLRHLNRLNHTNRARAASLARQAALKRIMYANSAREHERIELEKARLELEQGALVARDREVGDVEGGPLQADHGLARPQAETHHRHRVELRHQVLDARAEIAQLDRHGAPGDAGAAAAVGLEAGRWWHATAHGHRPLFSSLAPLRR